MEGRLSGEGRSDPIVLEHYYKSSGFQRAYLGTNSMVVSRLLGLRNPRTYFCAPGVEYFAAYAPSTASATRLPFGRTARMRTVRFPTWMAPSGSIRKVRYQPSGWRVHERANTRPSTTTAHTPMKRWSDFAPARTPMILVASTAATTGRGKRPALTLRPPARYTDAE